MTRLESRVGVGKKLHEVVLEPSTSLGSRLERIRVAAVGVVPHRARVRRTVTLATRLDPHVGVEKRVVGGRAGADTEASANDVAPIAPSLLFGRLDTVAAYV